MRLYLRASRWKYAHLNTKCSVLIYWEAIKYISTSIPHFSYPTKRYIVQVRDFYFKCKNKTIKLCNILYTVNTMKLVYQIPEESHEQAMYQSVINFNRAKKEESLSYYLISIILYQTIYDNRKHARERRARKIIATERKNRPSLGDDKIYSRCRKRRRG